MLLTLVALIACQSPDGTDDSGGSSSGKTDADRDGYGGKSDCDDSDPSIHPDQVDPCDGVDNDCDDAVDEDVDLSWYPDADADGWGDEAGTPVAACEKPEGHVSNHRDCDDARADVWPGLAEACDGVDNDCDGAVDEDLGDTVTVYPDADGDGAGDADATPVTTCAAMASGVENHDDCDDTDAGEPVYADPGGRRAATGTIEDPVSTIQAALDAASTCVRVNPGTYYEELNPSGKSLDVRSLGSSADTIVYSSTGASILNVYSGESTTFTGFTFAGGGGRKTASSYSDGSGNVYYTYSGFGGAVYLYGSKLSLVDVVIDSSSVYTYSYSSTYNESTGTYTYVSYDGYGGGVYAVSSTLRLTDVTVSNNYGSQGGGVYADQTEVHATRTAFLGNYATSFPGLYAMYGTQDLQNVVFNVNDDDYGYGALSCAGCDVTVENGTFVDNATAVLQYNGGVVDLVNTTIQGGMYGLYFYDGTFDAAYTNFYNLTGANITGTVDISGINGNMSVSSGFTDFNNNGDPTDDDLHLGGSSSLVDAGDPTATYNDADGSRNDVGAYGGPSGADW